LGKVPPDFSKEEQRTSLNKMGVTKPVIIAFRQEMDVMARVIKTVRMTLKNLKLAMEGTIVMSEDLANAQDSLFNAKVPAVWLKGNWFSPTVTRTLIQHKHTRTPTHTLNAKVLAVLLEGDWFSPTLRA